MALIKVSDAAPILDVHLHSAYRMAASGELTKIPFGKGFRLDEDEVRAYASGGKPAAQKVVKAREKKLQAVAA